MNTREKGYKDYGFADREEAARLIKYCRSHGFPYRCQLMMCAESANRSIANDIYDTIVNHWSYCKLSKMKYIPIGEKDFYAYRRKTLGKMREWLAGMGVKY